MLFHPMFLYFAGAGLFVYWHVAYLWSHWIIAIWLSAKISTAFQRQGGRTLGRAALRHVFIVGGLSLLIVAAFRPFAGMSLLNADFIDARETLRTLPPNLYFWAGIYFGFGLGEQLVHYYCDRCLFRFKDPRVRAIVGPLL
jgi:hypothetical protein